MMAPPPNGDPYDLVDPGQTNPEAWGAVVAWSAYATFAGGGVLDGFINDMYATQGVAI